MDTVDRMAQTYSRNTIQVAIMVLKKINQNDLVKNLSHIISKPTGRSLKKEYDKLRCCILHNHASRNTMIVIYRAMITETIEAQIMTLPS